MDDALMVAIKMSLGMITRENYTWEDINNIGIYRGEEWIPDDEDWEYMQDTASDLLHKRLSKLSGD